VPDLKADLIRQIETTIDVLRKDQERLKTQLAEIEPQLEEARAMLQLVKTGNAPKIKGKRRSPIKREDAVETLKFLPEEGFTYKDFQEVLEISSSAAQRWLVIFEEDELIYKLRESEMTANGRTATIWKVK
jgi:DNA-binding transcriptional ArsR family regulator